MGISRLGSSSDCTRYRTFQTSCSSSSGSSIRKQRRKGEPAMIEMGLCHSCTCPASCCSASGVPEMERWLERSEYSHASCTLSKRVRRRPFRPASGIVDRTIWSVRFDATSHRTAAAGLEGPLPASVRVRARATAGILATAASIHSASSPTNTGFHTAAYPPFPADTVSGRYCCLATIEPACLNTPAHQATSSPTIVPSSKVLRA